jgi:hypothetical protein
VHVGTSNGVLFVRPTFGSALGGTDGNVRFGTLASGNTIIYDAVDGVWKNANLTAGTGITITNAAGSITIAASGGGTGDVVGPASSTDNAVARFDGTTGKLVQNSSFVVNDSGEVTTGVWKGTEITVPYGGTGVSTLTGIVKGNGASAFSAATAGTDYLEPPSGTAILKANSGGALANATAGTDYLAPPSGTALLKANSGGALANATAGTDYVTPTGTETLTNKTLGATTLSGTLSCADQILDRPVLEDYAIQGVAIGNTGATRTIDLETGNFFSATLDQACTFTFSNPAASGDFCGFALALTDGDDYAVTWPASVDWVGGTAPTLTASGLDLLVFVTYDGGTTWLGLVSGTDIK